MCVCVCVCMCGYIIVCYIQSMYVDFKSHSITFNTY